jgi:UDP-N-acetylglucosamine pyrophosphorylase
MLLKWMFFMLVWVILCFSTFLDDTANKRCPTLQVPSGEILNFGDDNFVSLEAAGIKEAHNAAFVLVAGGLGERLGYKGIKVCSERLRAN